MMPISLLSTAPNPVASPGAPAAAVAAGVDFAALLPGGVAPVMPRQGDAEGGKPLPANDRDEAEVGAAAAWVTAPMWPAVFPPVDRVRGEATASAPTILPGERRGIVAAAVDAPVVQLIRGDEVIASGAGAAVTQPATPVATVAPLVQPVRGDGPHLVAGNAPVIEVCGTDTAPAVRTPIAPLVQPARTGEIPAKRVSTSSSNTGPRRGAIISPVAADVVTPTPPSRIRSERPGPVTGASVVLPPVAPSVLPAREGEAPVVVASQSVASLLPISGEAGVVTAPPPPAMAAATPEQRAPTGEPQLGEPRVDAAVAPAKVAAPAVAELQPVRIAPASQMFAAAIQRAVRDERRPVATDAALTLAAPTADLANRAVPAVETPHATLDMAQATWPTKMIERIELLRDAADAVDTSIRLMPDKLGTIDVSLKQDGDRVQVQFTAQQSETRQLLADAQPRLAELAEAKGLRLSMQTGDGATGGQPQQQRAAAPALTQTPRRAADQSAAGSDDERIA